MKQVTQRILIVFLLIVVTALSLKSCFHQQKETAILKDVVEIQQDSTSFWKDKYGSEHAQKQLAEANLSTLRSVYGQLLDSVRNRLAIKNSDVQAIYTGSTSASSSVTPHVDTLINSDSTRDYKFRYSDKWLNLDGVIGREPVINYHLTDSIVLTTYKKKTGFLRQQTYIDGYSLNPNVRVTGISGIRITNDIQQRFGIGPYIGYGWNGSTWSPSIGVSLQYSLIKF